MMNKRLLVVFFVLLLSVPAFAFSIFGPDIEAVDQAYVKENLGKPGIIVVDVRDSEIYNGKSPREGLPGGHIPGTINFPLADLKASDASEALNKAGITKDVTVIVYCNTGKQAGTFAEALVKDFNFDKNKIKNYKGSITDWAKNPENKLEPEDHE